MTDAPLVTLEAIAAAYEKAVATLQKHCLAKNTAKAQIEELRKDTREIGTAIFRTLHDAYRYYSRQGYHRNAVDAKVQDVEITICPSPTGVGHWDEDWRWHVPFQAHEIERLMLVSADEGNAEYQADLVCRELCWARNIIRRLEKAQPKTVEFTSKAELGRLVRDQFTTRWEDSLEKWYCYRGRPIYTSQHRGEAEQDPKNNRIVLFKAKDGGIHKTAFCMKIGDSTDTCWGFRCLGTEMYYIGDRVEHMHSMRELVERIIDGQPAPNA